MEFVGYGAMAIVIRALIEAVRAFVTLSENVVKGIVIALAAAFVYAYGLNALAEIGAPSKFTLFDQAITVIVLAYTAFVGNDLFDLIKNRRTG